MKLTFRTCFTLWAICSALAYFCLLFTGMLNYAHDGTPESAIAVDAIAVLSSYFLFKTLFASPDKRQRWIIALCGAPIALFTLVRLVLAAGYLWANAGG